MFDDLSVEKPGADLPLVGLPPHRLGPTAKVRRERVEVQLQAITGEYGQAIWCQHLHERVHDGMGHPTSLRCGGRCGLSARPNFQHGDDFGARVDSEPNPQRVHVPAGLGTDGNAASNWTCRRFRFWNSRSCNDVACSPARVSQVRIVNSPYPKTRTAAPTLRPSARALRTSPTRRAGVLRRYKTVPWRTLNFVWQAWHLRCEARMYSWRPCPP
jgi:hypothetical protein